MKQLITYLFLFLLVAFTIPLSAQYADIQNLSEHIEKGKIRLKLKQEVFQQSTGLKTMTVASDDAIEIGVNSIDRVGDQVGITRIRRVFPFSLKNEPKHREYGLHLWLEVDFDADADPEYVVAQYQALAEVDIAKPLFKKVRIDEDKKPVKYEAGKLQLIKEAPAMYPGTSLKSASEDLPRPNDPLFANQWHYENDGEIGTAGMDIDLLKAWTKSKGDSSVIVAIVDGGIDVHHEDLAQNIWINEAELNGEEGVDDDQNGYIDDVNGYNFVFPGDITPHDHGTHVAGTVGAVNNNGVGVAGVAGGNGNATGHNNGVRMISCQVFDDRTSSSGNFSAAIVYGADNGAVISQNSWGYTVPDYYEPEVLDAVRYFVAEAGQYNGSPMKGGVLFFAAGNDGLEQTHYPGSFEEVIAVTSTGPEGYAAPYTNYGTWTDIAAPGGDQGNYVHEAGVLSTLPFNEYGYYQGTSMACPHVSGVAALVLTKFGGDEMTPENLENIILNSTSRFIFNHEDKYGSGILNAANALADDEKIPPTPIHDFTATEIYHDEVRLQWTIPNDSDNFQPAYLILALSGAEITADNFDGKPQLVFENSFDAGTEVQVNIGGLLKQTDYWFALKSEDLFGNTSDISNVVKITTTDSPQFDLSTNSIGVTIDVTQASTYTETIQLSNVGEGLIHWENYVENERFYQDVEEELAATVAAKAEFAQANPDLFEVTATTKNQVSLLKSNVIETQKTDYWEYDETVYVAGMSYDNGQPAADLLSTYNPNAGLVSATRFDMEYDYTFNLTHLEVPMYNHVNDKPIIVELKKGSKKVEEAETVYMQEYYSDTTGVFAYQRIPLYRPQRFEDGEIFWVVLYFPKEDVYPLGLALDTYYPNFFLMSRDNGRSFMDMQFWKDGPFVPLVSALSTGDDGAYVFLKPGEGEIAGGTSQDVEVYVDANNLTEGKHLASVTLLTNDSNKPYVSLEVNVNVKGQQPAIDTTEVHDFSVLQIVSNELELKLKNIGLAAVEIYDIRSDEPGFAKNFNDTITLYTEYADEVPFTYTSTHIGGLETKVELMTNYGTIGIPVIMNSSAPAGMNSSITNNVLNLAFGETGTLNLNVTNDGTGSNLEYDLSHYSMLNKMRSIIPEMLSYNMLTSEDAGGPTAGSWDDISDIGTYYDGISVGEDTLDFKMRFPFFNEVMQTAYHGYEGTLYFYLTRENAVQLPAEDQEAVGKGVFAAMMFSDSSQFFPLDEFIHYSYGDREIFTVTVSERIMGDPNADTDKMTYQIVLFRDGAVEYRYKDVSALTPEMDYIVAIQGMCAEDFVAYRNLDETHNTVYDGLVIRFEPGNDAAMILHATPEDGLLAANESGTVELSVDPTMYDLYAGSYQNVVTLNANTANGTTELPFTVNITGSSSFEAVDIVKFETTNIGQAASELLMVTNTGTDVGELTNVTFNNADFTISETLPLSIQPKAHALLPIRFAPSVSGNMQSAATLTYSNGTSETVRLEGTAQVDPQFTHTIPAIIVVEVTGGETASVPFSFTALSSGGDLEYNCINSTFTSVSNTTIAKASDENGVTLDELYGYSWELDSANVFYKWESIKNDSEVLNIKSGKQYALELPFEFPFYGEVYDTIWISKNGYITVVKPDGEPFTVDFEENDGLAGMIAPFWSPLVASEDGEGVRLKQESDRILVQWDNFRGEDGAGAGGNISFQLEILSDGTIYFHYKSLSFFEGLLQYGLESPDESEVLTKPQTWILPWTELDDERTIAIAAPLKSTLKSGNTIDFNLDIAGDRFYHSGQYMDTVVVLTNSLVQPEVMIPVTVTVTGTPVLEATEALNWEDVIFRDNLTVRGTVEITNTGHETASISKVSFDQLDDLTLYDENGDEIIKNSAGTLLNPIEVEPWKKVQIEVEIPIEQFANVNGSITLEGNFTAHVIHVTADVVESPVFDWTATDQVFNLNTTDGGSYTFEIENNGETKLTYELVPAVVPKGDGGTGSAIIEKVGHYSFVLPNVVDSLALESKDEADGLFTPMAGVSILSFCNEFVAPEGGFFLTHVKAWAYLKQLEQYVTVMVYVGGDDPQAGEKVYEQNFVLDQQTDGQWVTFPLEVPVSITEGETFYVMVTTPVDRSFIGYDINTDQKLQEKTYVGVYWADGEFKWYSTAKEDWDNSIYKIRPLTAAGKNQWIELDHYSCEALSGEKVSVTATFDGERAGPGQHMAKLIVKSNDVNRPNDDASITVNVNGAPKVIYRPNQDTDTLSMVELDELLLNFMATDPEGEAITYELVELEEGPEVSFTQLDQKSAQMKIETDYESSGVYTWKVNITDAVGNLTVDSVLVEILDKNRPPVMNADYATITLNLADPNQAFTINGNDLFSDPDGDELSILAGNYTPEIVDLALGLNYIDIHPLQQGTGFLAFAADDGKADGFVVYGVYVFVLNDPGAVDGAPNGIGENLSPILDGEKSIAVVPNPVVNQTANVLFKLDEKANVMIEIFDMTGRKCRTAIHGQRAEGIYSEKIDVSHLSSGLYFCRYIINGEMKATTKMLIK